MKEKRHDSFYWFLLRAGFIGLAALLIMPLISFTPVLAENVVCTPTAELDSDVDGFTDAEELAGLVINGILYQTDPTIPDAFVEVEPDFSDSLFPLVLTCWHISKTAVFRLTARRSRFMNCLKYTVDSERRIPLGPDNSYVRPDGTCQKAVKIVEYRTSTDDCYTILGETEQGPPNNNKGPVYIFTDRITCFINQEYLCGSENTCSDSIDGAKSASELTTDLMLATIAHEGGHRYQLGPIYNSRFGGWHFKEGSFVRMEQASKVTARKTDVTFYMPKAFSDLSIPKTVLK